MDRKAIAVVVGCVALLVLWVGVIVPKYFPYKPLPPSTNTVNSAQSPMGTNGIHGTNATSTATAAVTAPSPAQFEVNTNTPEQLLVVTNKNARYTFSSYGGGLKLV